MKTVFITGGNSGLGFETSKQLLSADYAVIIGCRNAAKAEEAKSQLISKTRLGNVSSVQIDLSSFSSIRQSVHALTQPIDILICNAGIISGTTSHYTEDGIEETFGVNHLGHFLLTNLLLKKFNSLKKIVVISSNLHNPTTSKGIFPAPEISSIHALAYPDKENIKDKKKEASLRYVNSKLCNVWFVYELDRKLKAIGRKDVTVNAFAPGFIPDTNLSRNRSVFTVFLLKYILPHMKFMIKEIRTARQSAQNIVTLVQHIDISGKYFDGHKETASSDLSYDENMAAELWRESVSMTCLSQVESIV